MASKTVMAVHHTSACIELPLVGFGTGNSTVEPCEVGDAVEKALTAGVRHLDCAPLYGNQTAVGDAVARYKLASGDARATLWVTSKLWVTDFAPEHVEPACRHTLKELQVGRVHLHHAMQCSVASECVCAGKSCHSQWINPASE
jgi:diketogulonate reductase-like aldo/keto reductase